MKSQKDIFLEYEGDRWLERNSIEKSEYIDPLSKTLDSIPLKKSSKINVLEVGCGHGFRLSKLNLLKKWSVFGIDPSSNSITNSRKLNINALKATADKIPFDDNFFDLVIFGFCLYLCDRKDLFKISSEINRVLKIQSWLLIHDFWYPSYKKVNYIHNHEIYSHKDDLSKMFTWHPFYTLFSHKIEHHSTHSHTDDMDEWVGISLLRRNDKSFK